MSRRYFSILGIPIIITRSWFLIFAFVSWSLAQHFFPNVYPGLPISRYWFLGISGALLLYVSVVLHELGHALVARLHGMPVACVTLFMFGGVAHIDSGMKKPWAEFTVAIAGPIVSALLAWGFAQLANPFHVHNEQQLLFYALVRYLSMVNIMLLIFNLMPGFPLDGGRVVRAFLWWVKRDLRWATRVASGIGVAFAIALMALGAWWIYKGVWVSGLWYLLLGRFLGQAAKANFDAARA